MATPGGWSGLQPFPVNRWSRLLLLQQLLVDTLDLLDPFYVRTPEQHRWRLAPTPYKPLPNVRGGRGWEGQEEKGGLGKGGTGERGER